jgi:hypothetical protein
MVATFTIIYIIIVVVVVILLFILGLYTKISGTFMIILILVLLTIVFFTSAVYVTQSAADTGGGKVDDANKAAHSWYSTAAIISWIIIGLAVIALILLIIGAIFLFGSGEGEAGLMADGMVESVGARLGLSTEQMGMAKNALKWAKDNGSPDLLKKLKHDESHGLFDSLNKHKHGFGKTIKYVVLFSLYSIILLAFMVGLFAAIGAIIQSGSAQQKGLGKATVAATMSLFAAISVIVFMIVMSLREKSRQKAYTNDIQKATQEYTKNIYKTYYPDYYAQNYAPGATQQVQVPQQTGNTYTPYAYAAPQPIQR